MPDYLDRMERAIAYVESTLDRPFSLADVAREAGMSAFHFSRVFHCVTGEPVSEHARKRRLTRAADMLLASDSPVIDVALSCGFESQEAFTRAFRRWYGTPPARFRGRSMPYMLKDTPPLGRAALAALLAGEATMEPRLERRGERLFVGVACDNSGRRIRIPGNWGAFLRRMGEIEGAVDGSTYGIYRYDFSADPRAVVEDFPFRYLSALELAGGSRAEAPRGMEIWPVVAGRYAVFVHRGLLRDIGRTYRYIYKTWFPRRGERFAMAPMLERRAPDYPGDAPEAETEIWIPLAE
jgi:AraC family transcriptional regulator